MRELISVLLLGAASLFAVAGLGGHQVDQLLRDEQPVRYIAGELPEQEQFSEAVTEEMTERLVDILPDMAQSVVGDQVRSIVSPLVSNMLDNDRTREAWDESLQNTRTTYADQLDELFETGSTGDPSELDVQLDFSPVSAAMTEPLRDGLDTAFGWLPFVDTSTFDVLAPEIVVDFQAATDGGADPYTWATVAVASQYWVWFFVTAGAMVLVGLILGPGKSRWVALLCGSAIATSLAAWAALTFAAPSFDAPAGADPAVAALLDYVQERFTQWAQPSWWVFTAVAGFLTLLGVVGTVLAPRKRRRNPHVDVQLSPVESRV